jgi:copper oxidase (laccase) domain-containing protein
MLGMRPMAADTMVSQQNQSRGLPCTDCVLSFLYQPVSGQIAAIIHAGRLAGTVQYSTALSLCGSRTYHVDGGVYQSGKEYEVGKHVRDQLLVGGMKNGSLLPAEAA